MRHVVTTVALLLAVCGPALCRAQQPPESAREAGAHTQAPSGTLTRAEARGLLRRIGTVLADEDGPARLSGSLGQILGDPAINDPRQPLKPMTVNRDGTATVKNYTLTVVVSRDGKRFEVRLWPVAGCDVAYFIGDSFVIYEARALGCPE